MILDNFEHQNLGF